MRWLKFFCPWYKEKEIIFCDFCRYCYIIEPNEKGVCQLGHKIEAQKVEGLDIVNFVPKDIFCTDFSDR